MYLTYFTNLFGEDQQKQMVVEYDKLRLEELVCRSEGISEVLLEDEGSDLSGDIGNGICVSEDDGDDGDDDVSWRTWSTASI